MIVFWAVNDATVRTIIVSIFAVIYFCIRFVLVRFRLNDISPDTQVNLAKRGFLGLFGNWMIDFAPSSGTNDSSFEKTRRFYIPGGKPNMKNYLLNIAVILLVAASLGAIFFYAPYKQNTAGGGSPVARTRTGQSSDINQALPQTPSATGKIWQCATSQFSPISIAKLNAYGGSLPYLNGDRQGVEISGTVVEKLTGSNTGFIILEDGSGNFAEINNNASAETALSTGDTLITDGYFLYRNTAMSQFPASMPIIYGAGVCRSYQ